MKPFHAMLKRALVLGLVVSVAGAVYAKPKFPKEKLLPLAAAVAIPRDALPGLTANQVAAFSAGKLAFAAPAVAATGLGPVFNGRSCGECHPQGNGSTRTGNIIGDASPLAISLGGPVIQVKAIPGFKAEKVPKTIPVGVRRAMTCQGLGLVGAVTDAAIQQEQALQLLNAPLVAGKARQVVDSVTLQYRVGRIGQKCQEPNSTSFAAGAYLQELGITTPFKPQEVAAYNNPANLAHNPKPGINDDGGNVIQFGIFMDLLAPPQPNPPKTAALQAQVQAGEAVFHAIGCGVCHKQTWTTSAHSVAALSFKTFHPYSDFLLHDMGASGDQIQQGVDFSNAAIPGSYMRTTPLWGCRLNPFLWHDGRVKKGDFAGAINQHAGQGLASKNLFNALPATQKQSLIAFLNSL